MRPSAERLSPACPLPLRDTTAKLRAIPTPLAYHGSPGRKAPIRTPIRAWFGPDDKVYERLTDSGFWRRWETGRVESQTGN